MLQDLRYAVRSLRSTPGFTLMAVLALALGIGVNTAIFSVVHAVLLRPLPYPQSNRLVELVQRWVGGENSTFSGMRFLKTVDVASSFQAATAFDNASGGLNLSNGGEPERIDTLRVTPLFFRTFGVQPLLGRGFAVDDGRAGGPAVMVISHGLWQRRFGGDPKICDATVIADGVPWHIVGVMPSGFASSPDVDVWLPLQIQPDPNDVGNVFRVVARLKEGRSIDQANAELHALQGPFLQAFPNMRFGTRETETVAVSIQEAMTGEVRPALLILLGAVAMVLLIACGNVSNLLLARGTARAKEIAVRVALGASTGRIVRLLLMESAALALAGAGVGLLLGSWLLGFLVAIPQDIPRLHEVSMDGTVLLVMLAVSLATMLVFGVAPALQAARAGATLALQETGRGASAGQRARRLRDLLIVFEMALCLVLLVSATLLVRSFVTLRKTDPGFRPENVLSFKVSLTPAVYRSTERIGRFARELVVRLEALPGVVAAGATTSLPLESSTDLSFEVEGHPSSEDLHDQQAQLRVVTPNYFKAMGTALRAGRFFADRDGVEAEPVIVVNQALARRHFKDAGAMGAHITIGRAGGPAFTDMTRSLIGIVGDMKEVSLDDQETQAVYLPFAQMPSFLLRFPPLVETTSWVVRGAASPAGLLNAIRREVRQVDPSVSLAEIRDLRETVALSIAQPRFNMILMSLFAALALALAVIGVYGVVAYSLAQRTREIGIRLALGASPGGTLRMVVGETMKLAAAGAALGLVGAFAVGRLMTDLLFGVSAADPATFVLATALLLAAAGCAGLVAARRALRVDPMTALRSE